MPGITTSAVLNTSNTLEAREIDFVTRFNKNWDALKTILGIMRPIRKTPGTQLVTYNAKMHDSALATSPAEGQPITFTQFEVEKAGMADLTIEKYGKSTTIEAVEKYGADVAVRKTDEAFLNELTAMVLGRFYTFLKTGTLQGKAKTWQKCLAQAKGAVLEQFAGMDRTVTEVVGFANIMDLYNYLGDAPITVQTMFGLQYVENFLGYSRLFLLPDKYMPSKKVIAVPVENIDLYYIDPADSEFASLGLSYTVQGETNLIGFHAQPNYNNATGEVFALMGMTLWAEYLNGICIMDVSTTEVAPAVVSA